MTKQKSQIKNDHEVLNRAVLVAGLLGPIASVPQAWVIFATQDARGVSLLTWALFIVTNSAMLVYGIVYRLRPIVLSNIAWLAIELVIVVGIIMHT